jgi:hypothetical protein
MQAPPLHVKASREEFPGLSDNLGWLRDKSLFAQLTLSY